MQRQARRTVALVLALATALATAGRADPSAALLPVLTPGANIVFFADAKAMQAAPIQAKIESAREDAQEAAGAAGLDVRKQVEKLYEALGITEDDFESVLFAMNLDNVDPGGQTNFEELDLALGLVMAKPVRVEQIKTAFAEFDAAEGRSTPLAEEEYRGVKLLVAKSGEVEADAQVKLPQLVLTSIGDGKLLVGGSAKGVKATIDRYQSGEMASLDSALGNARSRIAAGSQMYLIFVPSPSLTAKFGEMGPDPQKNPLLASSMRALTGAKSLVFSMKADTALAAELMLTLGSEGDGMQIKAILDAYVLGLGKAWLLSKAKRPIPAINSLQSAQDGATVKLSFALTEEDVEFLQSLKPAPGRTPQAPAGAGDDDGAGAGAGSGVGRQRPGPAQPDQDERVRIVIPKKL